MRFAEMIDCVWKAVWGTDQLCKSQQGEAEDMIREAEEKVVGTDPAMSAKLGARSMKAASQRLEQFQPAANLTEALEQVVGMRR